MKLLIQSCFPGLRLVVIASGLLLLSACSTSGTSSGYPYSARNYSYYPQSYPQTANHSYYPQGYYYGNYQPGWFVVSGYSGGYYPGFGYGPVAYWPTYSSSYYRHSYYPYYDPWYYSYSSYYRRPFGYGSGYHPGYGPGGYYPGNPYYNRPYYGGSNSYRPPAQQPPPNQDRPDPVVIPPDQRGRWGAGGGYNDRVDDGLREREIHQPDRRSATVVSEERDMSRSVIVAPGQNGDQGMTITNRSERKERPSRLQPVEIPNDGSASQQSISSLPRSYSTLPDRSAAPEMPTTNRRREQVYRQTEPRYEPGQRQQPAPVQAPGYQQPAAVQAPVYNQQLGPANQSPEFERRPQRDPELREEREPDYQND